MIKAQNLPSSKSLLQGNVTPCLPFLTYENVVKLWLFIHLHGIDLLSASVLAVSRLSNNAEQTITGGRNRLNRTIIIKPFYSHINGLTYRFELILLTTASL